MDYSRALAFVVTSHEARNLLRNVYEVLGSEPSYGMRAMNEVLVQIGYKDMFLAEMRHEEKSQYYLNRNKRIIKEIVALVIYSLKDDEEERKVDVKKILGSYRGRKFEILKKCLNIDGDPVFVWIKPEACETCKEIFGNEMEEDHINCLIPMIDAAKDELVNVYNMEFPWYSVWSKILEHWFNESYVCPQYKIFYDEKRFLITDFVVRGKFSKDRAPKVGLIVEVKRSLHILKSRLGKDAQKKKTKEQVALECELGKAKEQLEEQVAALFIERNFEAVHGIVSIGNFWQYCMYSRSSKDVNEKSHKRKLKISTEISFTSPIYDLEEMNASVMLRLAYDIEKLMMN